MVDAGETFDGYVVDEKVGRGGSAIVYRAHDRERPDHVVALKILTEEHRTAPERARLDREFEFAHRLGHPHIVEVYAHGPHWLAMQFIDGGKSTRLQRLEQRLAALAQISDALDYIHRCGVVHADVKPANILVAKYFSGTGAVLVDFGVAHAVVEDVFRRPKNLQASLSYAAPEVLRGHAPTAATDQYALACSAVELITGAPPFTADTAAQLVDAHLRGIPPRISRKAAWLPRAFDAVIAKAMARDPELRYQSCAEFVDHLTRVLR
ncbi:protein kinase family protein [Mycobacterium xenopi RIVM700367]|uniref:serine/threonine-protein kinase n=1 Tax=Mycobacterium xenopi TaxID=1789 RepID=UPI00025ADA6E|nr:serine/threonine-protein kinase [Mycobacterium xenopi]EID10159.1 protein kinase family protein [Mycobacterium xenopi RIVM700367]